MRRVRLLALAGLVALALLAAWLTLANRAEDTTSGAPQRETPLAAERPGPFAAGEDAGLTPLDSDVTRAAATAPDQEGAPQQVARRVLGRAVHADGSPFPGAPLALAIDYAEQGAWHLFEKRSLQADEAGAFAADLPARSEPLRITASRAAEATEWPARSDKLVVWPDVSPTRSLEVTFYSRSRTLTGVVVDERGEPLGGAMVMANHFAAQCDAQGTFTVRVVPQDMTFVSAWADGYAEGRIVPNTAATGDLVQKLRIELERECVVTGTIRDGSGLPVEGARVTSWMAYYQVATSDHGGSFRLAHLPSDGQELDLKIEKEGFPPAHASVYSVAGEATVEIVLEPGSTLVGRVEDAAGMPVPGALVEIEYGQFDSPRDGFLAEGTTVEKVAGPDGSFVFEHVPATPFFRHVPGAPAFRILARRSGFAPGVAMVVANDGEKDLQAVVRLGVERTVEGRVVDRDGAPCAGVHVAVESAGASLGSHSRATTDDHGRFRLEGMPDEELHLTAFGDEFVYAFHTVPMQSDVTEEIVIVITRAARLSGVVLDDATGAPIQDFKVRIVPPLGLGPGEQFSPYGEVSWHDEGHEFTGAVSGAWESGPIGLVPGKFVGLEFLAEGYAVARVAKVELREGDSRVVVRLEAAVGYRGRLLDAEGEAVAGATVHGLEGSGKSWSPVDEAKSDAAGEFLLRRTSGAALKLVVQWDRLDWATQDVSPGWTQDHDGDGRSIHLPAFGSITGEVAAEVLAEDSAVDLLQQGVMASSNRRSVQPDAAGRFGFVDVPPGPYELRHRRPGIQTRRTAVGVEANGTVHVRLD